MNEEHLLYFNEFRIRLSYTADGSVDMLRLEHHNQDEIVIRSKSASAAPEKLYELLRECEIVWTLH